MGVFVIRNNDTGKYVARPGSPHSFTTRLENAHHFASRDAASKDACGDETVFAIEDVPPTGRDH